MNLNDLKEMCNKDTTIGIDLDGYSISIPELANKYHQLAFDERKTLRFLEAQYDIIKLSKWKYYSGKANPDEYDKEPFDLKVSAIARGISVGDELEYADELTLGRSLINRVPYESTLAG